MFHFCRGESFRCDVPKYERYGTYCNGQFPHKECMADYFVVAKPLNNLNIFYAAQSNAI